MKENGKISIVFWWPVIIIVLCVFWPVGILLIIGRVSVDKKAALSVGKLVGIAGGVSYVMAILGLVVCLSDGFTSDDVIMILFFAIAGFALRKVAKKIVKDAEDVKQYLSIIVNGNVRQMDNIAATTGKSYEIVRSDIQKMIKKGYLKNAYINESTREVVLPNSETSEMKNVNNSNKIQAEKIPTKIVACSCCGANNTIAGEQGECEYCGSPIK